MDSCDYIVEFVVLAWTLFVYDENLKLVVQKVKLSSTVCVNCSWFQCVQLIFIEGDICARGYWNIPDDSAKEILLGWFEKKIQNAGLFDLKDTTYFPQDAGNYSFYTFV